MAVGAIPLTLHTGNRLWKLTQKPEIASGSHITVISGEGGELGDHLTTPIASAYDVLKKSPPYPNRSDVPVSRLWVIKLDFGQKGQFYPFRGQGGNIKNFYGQKSPEMVPLIYGSGATCKISGRSIGSVLRSDKKRPPGGICLARY